MRVENNDPSKIHKGYKSRATTFTYWSWYELVNNNIVFIRVGRVSCRAKEATIER